MALRERGSNKREAFVWRAAVMIGDDFSQPPHLGEEIRGDLFAAWPAVADLGLNLPQFVVAQHRRNSSRAKVSPFRLNVKR
jgi:hypothetical protein